MLLTNLQVQILVLIIKYFEMGYLYIITKQEFTSLYRFGKIPLIADKIISTANLSAKEIDLKVYDQFLSLPYFVGDEEYLIISFENILIDNIWLEIEDVSEVIPLTKAAKSSFQMKFDSKLDFKHPRFENIVQKVEDQINIEERYRGAKAFWILCQVKSEYKPLLNNALLETSYYNRINAIKSDDFTDDFFIHLLTYDRYEFFPNSDVGYFYDVGLIYAHSRGASTFKPSAYYQYLEANKADFSKKSFLNLATIISNSEEVVKFKEKLTHNGLKQYIASAIFLKFKDDLGERDTIRDSDTGKLIGEIRKDKQFIDELNLAIYLTGSFFGYKKFYDDLYELVDLNIFKKKVEKPKLKAAIQESKNEELVDETNQPILENDKEKIDLHLDGEEEDFKQSPETRISDIKEDKVENIISTNNSEDIQSSGIKQYILEEILQMLEKENGAFDIKKDYLKGLQQILIPITDKKTKPLKPEVFQILKDEFHDVLQIDINGKQNILKRKIDGDLFSST